jgi:uncharacterized protein with von Willebrand factor type A (vWA) domain
MSAIQQTIEGLRKAIADTEAEGFHDKRFVAIVPDSRESLDVATGVILSGYAELALDSEMSLRVVMLVERAKELLERLEQIQREAQDVVQEGTDADVAEPSDPGQPD